jgi:hypothetical protein
MPVDLQGGKILIKTPSGRTLDRTKRSKSTIVLVVYIPPYSPSLHIDHRLLYVTTAGGIRPYIALFVVLLVPPKEKCIRPFLKIMEKKPKQQHG